MGSQEEVCAPRVTAAAVVASAALSAAGIWGAAVVGSADPKQDTHETAASLDWRVEQTMLTARVVATSQAMIPKGSAADAVEPAEPRSSEDTSADGKEADLEPRASDPAQERPTEEAGPDESPHSDLPASPQRESKTTTRQGPRRAASEAERQDRSRNSPANQRAREIAQGMAAAQTAIALEHSTSRAQGGLGIPVALGVDDSAYEPHSGAERQSDLSSAHGSSSPRKSVAIDDDSVGEEEPGTPVVSEALDRSDRHLLFVWDNAVVRDLDQGGELLKFAVQRGFNTLAIEATPVGYGDSDLTAAFERFNADADELGIDVYALVGYPWFTVSPGAGLPGQPTSSLEGVAVLSSIAATGLFDGVIDDSAPYGVEYELDGTMRNWLFDEPEAAGLDLQAWLRSAKEAIGTLPLLKTTPFWYDSHPDLSSVTDLDGRGYQTLGHLIASEVDAMVVLAYRDELSGPNGILELSRGEMNMGPTILTVETGDLGAALSYLTFADEGLTPLEDTLSLLRDTVDGFWAFAGTGVHHYQPFKELADSRAAEEAFSFIGTDSVTMDYGALADAYDSSLGRYYDQMAYQEAIGVVAGIGLGAIASNGGIELQGGSLVFGAVRPGVAAEVSEGYGTIITGEQRSLSTPIVLDPVEEAANDSRTRLSLGWNSERRITGSGSYDRIRLSSYARLFIDGPAEIVINDVRLGSDAYIYCDTTNGPVTLTINERLDLSRGSWIAPTSLQARDLTIYYASARTIDMSNASRLLTDIYAPKAHIRVGNEAEIYGRASARSLEVKNAGELHLDIDLLNR